MDAEVVAQAANATTTAGLGQVLRTLRRREARERGDSALTYRELAAKTGWSVAAIGEYVAGTTLPPTDRFDVLVQLLGATPDELGPLADAPRPGGGVASSGPAALRRAARVWRRTYCRSSRR